MGNKSIDNSIDNSTENSTGNSIDNSIDDSTYAATLAELVILVVEVLSDADAPHLRPRLLGGQQHSGEDDGVEGHIVLAHELDQLHILLGSRTAVNTLASSIMC